jgi:uncharacterized PurR-regulated membrane protein YhhQ (DUF165 family)
MQTQSNSSNIPLSLFAGALLYGGLCVLAGVLGTKIASLGDWPVVGHLAVESGIFAFLLLVVLGSATAELHGATTANRLVRFGFVPLIVSMILLVTVINVVPPAPFWHDQDAFARLLGQGARMQMAGWCPMARRRRSTSRSSRGWPRVEVPDTCCGCARGSPRCSARSSIR